MNLSYSNFANINLKVCVFILFQSNICSRYLVRFHCEASVFVNMFDYKVLLLNLLDFLQKKAYLNAY